MKEVSTATQVNNQNVLSEIADDVLQDAIQTDSKAALATNVEENSVAGMLAKTKKLEPENKTDSKLIKRIEKGLFIRKEMENLADGFCKRDNNAEYHLSVAALTRLAVSLGEVITPDTSYDELVDLIRQELTEGAKIPNAVLVDKTFDFLLEVVQVKLNQSEGLQATFLEKLYENIANVKIRHYEIYQNKIETGHHIIGAADSLVTKNRDVSECLDHLERMIDEKQDVHTKYRYFKELGYAHKDIREEFKILFHHIGSKLKNKIDNPYLQLLLEEIKVAQSVLGVYKQASREFSSMLTHLKRSTSLFT